MTTTQPPPGTRPGPPRSGRASSRCSAPPPDESSSATSSSTAATGSSSSAAWSSRCSTCSRSASASGSWSATSPWPTAREVSYVAFVAPAMLASAAMNGALFDSTYNIFFRLKYNKLYDAMLATPIGPNDIARGEITWALLRGGCYSASFIVVMLRDGAGRVVVDAAGAAGDPADRLRLRRCRDGADDLDAELAGLRVHPALDHADVLVLGDVLPAVDLPRRARDRRELDAALPGRGADRGASRSASWTGTASRQRSTWP